MHGRFVGEGDEGLTLVEVWGVEGPKSAWRNGETNVEKPNTTDVGRFLKMMIGKESHIVNQHIQFCICNTHLGKFEKDTEGGGRMTRGTDH